MSNKDRPNVEVREGKVFLDDVKQDLELESILTFRLRLKDMSAISMIDFYSEKANQRRQIRAIGTLQRGSIQVLGLPQTTTQQLNVVIGAAPIDEEERFSWRADLGWIAADWETNTSEQWYLQCYFPQSTFDEIDGEYRAGRLRVFSLGIKGGLWAPWSPLPALDHTKWHLLPGQWGTGHAVSKVDALVWGDARLPGDEQEEEETVSSALAEPISSADRPQSSERMEAVIKRASEPMTQILSWGIPAIVILLGIIAYRLT